METITATSPPDVAMLGKTGEHWGEQAPIFDIFGNTLDSE